MRISLIQLVGQGMGGGPDGALIALSHQRSHGLPVQRQPAKGHSQQQGRQRQDDQEEELWDEPPPREMDFSVHDFSRIRRFTQVGGEPPQ
jgi:hypothetical protein